MWFNVNIPQESIEDYLEGSPVDRVVFLLLIIAGSVFLLKRRVNWGSLLKSNKWFFAFFIYCAISIIWSQYPYVALKRWAKDVGNVIMILIILTERDHVNAVKAVFTRYIYLAIPLSVVFIKYFPEIGREYNRWTWVPSFIGVSTNKNDLGMILIVCGLFLVWDFFDVRTDQVIKESTEEGLDGGMEESMGPDRSILFGRIILMAMLAWLLVMIKSSTAIVCLLLGIGSYFLYQSRKVTEHFGAYTILLVLIVLSFYVIGPRVFISILGKDATLTGRTELWADLLNIRIVPLIGAGYKSFWMGPWVLDLWEKYAFRVNQAHNGYLEIYLNGGLIGVGLLLAMIVSTGSKLKKELLDGDNLATFVFSLFITALISNLTEATFNALSIIWLVILLAALYYPPSSGQPLLAENEVSETFFGYES
jgi:O-antigen ligase